MADDPIAAYLASLNISDTVKAAAWDAAYADDDKVAEAQMRKLPKYLAPKVLETLWDLRQGAPLPGGVKPFKTPSAEDFAPAGPEGSALERFTSAAGAALNPITMVTGLVEAVSDPVQTAKNIYAAGAAEAGKAADAYRQGRYSEAVGHGAAAALPVIGPAAAAAGEQIATGDVAGGLGAGTGLVASILAPTAIAKTVKSVPIVPRLGKNVPAPVAEAVQFGLREGVPVDVATATGNRFLQGIQKLSEGSFLGTPVGQSARAAQAEALTATGERLAGRAFPSPVTAEQAGQAVRDAVTRRAAAYDAAADVAYTKLRGIEAKVGMPVDITATKAAMRPIYEELKHEAKLVPLMGDKARVLTTLDRLLQAPDVAPLSIADRALGDLKTLARVDQTFRRTAGQGVAAEAVRNLDKAVRATAQQAGPDAMRALMDGRAATVNKFKIIDVLDDLKAEPVKVFNEATWAQDAGIARLRELARVAPNEVRQIGRAWIDNAMTKATAEGFSGEQGLLRKWQTLGPQTKQLLFRDPAHIKDLDNFFLLAKKLAENPNPSGTALTTARGAELLSFTTGAGIKTTLAAPIIAKLLFSPRTTRLLLQGLRLPVSATAARTAWAGQLGRLLQEQAPALADEGAPP